MNQKTKAHNSVVSLFVVHLAADKLLIAKRKIVVGGTGLEPVTSSV